MSSRLDDPHLDHAITAVLGDIVAAAPEPCDRPARAIAPERPTAPTSRVRLLVTAAIVGGVAAIMLVARPPRETAPADGPGPMIALPVPAAWPSPGSVDPSVDHTPAGLGPATEAQRDGANRTGDWAALAIARPDDGGGYTDPITVAVFDGTWSALADADPVTAGGRTYSSARWNGYEVLATSGPRRLAVAGAVDRATLLEIIGAVVPDTTQRPWAVTLTALPPGYELIVPLRELADDPTPRASAAIGTALVVNEVSDWGDPLLAAAATGADLTRHDVAGNVAWSGTTTSNDVGALTFLVWAPEPGVVFEVVSSDPTSVDELIAVAEATTPAR